MKPEPAPVIVQIESPLAAPSPAVLERNLTYARLALRDSLLRGEAPFASHLLYAQPDVLDDNDPAERELGIRAGLRFLPAVALTAVYTDLGISTGMQEGITRAHQLGIPIDYRTLADSPAITGRNHATAPTPRGEDNDNASGGSDE